MTGIALLQADDGHAPAAGGGRMTIDAFDTRNTELVEIVPHAGRPDNRKEPALFAGRIIRHQRIGHDRLVAVMQCRDFDQRCIALGPAVIAGELAERALTLHRAGFQYAFDHQLGIGRDQQVRRLAFYDRDGLIADSTDEFIF